MLGSRKNENCNELIDCEGCYGSDHLTLSDGCIDSKDCYDCTVWGVNMELDYEDCLCGDHSYSVKFSSNCWPACKDIEYSIGLVNCSDCFGCVSLKKKQYYILNKQYTKEEYFKLVEKIKKHMDDFPFIDKKGNIYKYGEFFPIEFSPFGYNNTMAIQYFNMSKEKAEESGYPWIEIPHGEYQITIKSEQLPDSCEEIKTDILKEIIECAMCKNAYRIMENELSFYKKEKLPLPNLCSECRYEIRISDRLKLELYKRQCMCFGENDSSGKYKNTVKHSHGNNKCGEEFKTGYAPDRPEIIYCEKCYQQEVY
ncbi:MAG TPA: hypothetical protein PKZ36_03075 [Candidatus Paceibacterota bacterium]|nr:hypothetical protein [Candidatus Paceibacterota bacterium]HPT18361.1 hypothetical protein [Candidatus Paceibacterota bacterium]